MLHEEAQGQLSHLEDDIRRKIAKLQVIVGRASGDCFYLYSYQTFSLSDDDRLDPVVAGITFSSDRTDVKIEAEISGEPTGDIILSLPTNQLAGRSLKVRGRLASSGCRTRPAGDKLLFRAQGWKPTE